MALDLARLKDPEIKSSEEEVENHNQKLNKLKRRKIFRRRNQIQTLMI